MKYFWYVFLQAWYLIAFGVFVSSLVRRDPDPWSLILCLIGVLLWVRLVRKDGRL
jgi:uncharacterized membrane protein YraQ (UPF0718 family)